MGLTENMSEWVNKAFTAFAIAAVLGGGSTIIQNRVDNVRQDAKLAEYESLFENIDALNAQLTETNTNLAILNDRASREVYDVPRD
tara:strand:- start:12505 stop:12762 length:258 start_codon:yes stop_codon:yes gene_type:complete